jgi:hypothetical protein
VEELCDILSCLLKIKRGWKYKCDNNIEIDRRESGCVDVC